MKLQHIIISAALTLGLSNTTLGQIAPLSSSFFQNQYLNNPALAGSNSGVRGNIAYRQQFNSIPGEPVNQALTLEYGSSKNVGLGLQVYSDRSGLFKTTRVVGSYAYTLRFENDRRLQFGLSLGFMNQRISTEDVNGDPNDFQLDQFSNRQTYVDGDFGIAYQSGKFSAQLAIPELKNQLGRDITSQVNYPRFFSSVAYQVKLVQLDAIAEPRVNYRGVQGLDNVVDAGLNLALADRRLNLFGMYHSTQSFTFGMGITYQSINISGMYATGTSMMRNYANGDFEVNLAVYFPGKTQ